MSGKGLVFTVCLLLIQEGASTEQSPQVFRNKLCESIGCHYERSEAIQFQEKSYALKYWIASRRASLAVAMTD